MKAGTAYTAPETSLLFRSEASKLPQSACCCENSAEAVETGLFILGSEVPVKYKSAPSHTCRKLSALPHQEAFEFQSYREKGLAKALLPVLRQA